MSIGRAGGLSYTEGGNLTDIVHSHLTMIYPRANCRTALIVASLVVAGCTETTAPPKPASIARDQTTVADGTAGIVLASSPTFVVKDRAGDALSGVAVTVAVTAGGGTLTEAPTLSKGGPTSVGKWKLGNIAGVNSLTVTVAGLEPLVISVNGKAGPAASIVFVSGADQFAPAGTPVPVSPVAQVRDQFGNGVSGASVAFGIAQGDGTVSITPVISDASGNATSPQWTLGKSAVPQSLRAFSGGFAALINAIVESNYEIDVRFFGPPMPPAAAAMFAAAAARIRGSVVGDVGDIEAPVPAIDFQNECGVAGLPTAFSEPIDDVIVYASVGPIDGASSVLAFSFPCFIRGPAGSPNRQTVIGVMKFDSDDIDNMIARGNLTDVIQHEMLHIVGIGTLWKIYGVLAGAGTAQTRYTGALGVGGCVSVGGATACPGSVPVENIGGAGTADSHWREETFFNELMTGFVNTSASVPGGLLNPYSAMSIQSLADIGYVVNVKAADPYSVPGTSAIQAARAMSAEVATPWEKVMTPKMFMSPAGKITLVVKQ
jgi:hypothetical protein